MAYGIRVSLPGYNALTDTNPDHFALKSDLNDILIKEYTRGTRIVAGGLTETITHNLGYVPFFIIFYDYFNLKNYGYGWGFFTATTIWANTSQIFFLNKTGNSMLINYYIFYDKII